MRTNLKIEYLKPQIEARMRDKGLNLLSLQKKAGLGGSSINNILLGRSKDPQIGTLMAISNALECSVEELLADPNSPRASALENDKALLSKVWDTKLFQNVLKSFNKYCEDINYFPNTGEALFIVKEIYLYSLRNNDQEPDEPFVKWFISKNLG